MTPERSRSRLTRSLPALLLAIFAMGVLAPSALAASSGYGITLRGLRPGTSGPAVRTLQRQLAKLGYAIKADGQFGAHTARAVRTFRTETHMPRSSRVTKKFVRLLGRARNGGPGDNRWLGIRRLAVGTRGHDVRLLQHELTKLGYAASSDGQFGPQTRTSVRLFERAAGLSVDGVVSVKEARTLKRIARSGHEAGAVSKRATTLTTSGVATTTPTTTPATAPATTTPATTLAPNLVTGETAPSSPADATIGPDGLAIPPAGAPAAVIAIIQAGNQIAHMPYRYGGGHESWTDTGYDCSGSVSFALHGAGLLDAPLSSYEFPAWGQAGPGQWVTVYGNEGHAYMVVAGLRFDTSASKGGGSRWTTEPRSPSGYVASHPAGM